MFYSTVPSKISSFVKRKFSGAERLILDHRQAPGDTVCMTGLVRDIALQYPGRFHIDVSANGLELFENNPYITHLDPRDSRVRSVLVHHEAFASVKGRREHLMMGYYRSFNRALGTNVVPSLPIPDIHLSPQEKTERLVEGDYWVICAGGKSDMTTKHWVHGKFAEVVKSLSLQGIRCVQIGDNAPGHCHYPIPHAIDMIGRTTLRQVCQLVYHSLGVISPITFVMHVAAALSRPCVVVAGGREDPYLFGYSDALENFSKPMAPAVSHKIISSIGSLSCCATSGCYFNKVQSIPKNGTCLQPRKIGEQTLASCMAEIDTHEVVDAVLSYSENPLYLNKSA